MNPTFYIPVFAMLRFFRFGIDSKAFTSFVMALSPKHLFSEKSADTTFSTNSAFLLKTVASGEKF